ncbi:hypothetical protein AB0F64_12745 [Streptomyces sp. NPDC026294]|uniref:hypothetical protein n=1 Tax=Streptomyces sp. NPDC026294 TaxID=3155362 RepID=UPI0033C668DC
MNAPDYRIDGFEAASDRVEYDFIRATLSDDMYTELAAHHTADESFLLFYDRAASWDAPGTAEYVGMHVQRDSGEGTLTFESTRQPTVPLAQNWLVSQGCPREASELGDTPGPRPADALTSRLEDRLRANPGGRYTLLEDYTHNPSNLRNSVEVSTLFHAVRPESTERPYRETAPSFATYTVHEGAFTSAEAVGSWLSERDEPLPLAPAPTSTREPRTTAARTRSTSGAVVNYGSSAPAATTAAAPSQERTRRGPS